MKSPKAGVRFRILATCNTQPLNGETWEARGSNLRVACERAGNAVSQALKARAARFTQTGDKVSMTFQVLERPHKYSQLEYGGRTVCGVCGSEESHSE